MSAHVLLSVLLALLPVPAGRRACIVARRAVIEAQLESASRAEGVAVELLLAVGYLESHLGCAPGSGGSWGAPISPRRRHTAGTARHAAAALALGYRQCGDTRRALSHFRCGRCRCGRLVGYTPRDAMSLAARIRRRAQRGEFRDGVEKPSGA